MLVQSIKLTGICALMAAGALGTIVVAQQTKGRAGASGPPAVNEAATVAVEPAKIKKAELAEVATAVDALMREKLDQKNRIINQKLDQMIPADFAQVTTLEQLLKQIRKTTTDDHFPGIPIYVNPVGLMETQSAMRSEVGLPCTKCPLRQALLDTLHPLHLSYIVKDGFLMIDSRATITEMRVEAIEHKLDRVLESLERLSSTAK